MLKVYIHEHTSLNSSFSLDLSKWLDVSKAYDNGNFKYHCTLPTENILDLESSLDQFTKDGLDNYYRKTEQLSNETLDILEKKGASCCSRSKSSIRECNCCL